MKKRVMGVMGVMGAMGTSTSDGFIPHEPMHGVLAPVALDFEKHKRLKGVRSDLKPPPMRDSKGRLLYVLPGGVFVTKVVYGDAI